MWTLLYPNSLIFDRRFQATPDSEKTHELSGGVRIPINRSFSSASQEHDAADDLMRSLTTSDTCHFQVDTVLVISAFRRRVEILKRTTLDLICTASATDIECLTACRDFERATS